MLLFIFSLKTNVMLDLDIHNLRFYNFYNFLDNKKDFKTENLRRKLNEKSSIIRCKCNYV